MRAVCSPWRLLEKSTVPGRTWCLSNKHIATELNGIKRLGVPKVCLAVLQECTVKPNVQLIAGVAEHAATAAQPRTCALVPIWIEQARESLALVEGADVWLNAGRNDGAGDRV